MEILVTVLPGLPGRLVTAAPVLLHTPGFSAGIPRVGGYVRDSVVIT